MCDKTNNIYEIDECDYCGNRGIIVRPSPFLIDNGAKMCEYCWNETQKEYIHSTGENIPNFKDVEMGYDKIEKEYNNIDKTISIGVETVPKWIRFNCPYCLEDIEIDQDEFEDDMPINYWRDCEGNEIKCPNCNHELKIGMVDYD